MARASKVKTWGIVIGLIIGVAATLVILVYQSGNSEFIGTLDWDNGGQKTEWGPGLRFDNQTFFRSAAPFGHHLGILASYSGSEASIGVGNPSGYEFRNCSVILDTAVGDIANTTLKTYDRILPDSYDYFTAELEGSNNGNAPSWLILECKEPYELATTPRIFIGKLDYMPGESANLKGMMGYSQVTVRVMDSDGKFSVEKMVSTNNGFLQYSFLIPENAKPGIWLVQVESYSETYGQDFTVSRK